MSTRGAESARTSPTYGLVFDPVNATSPATVPSSRPVKPLRSSVATLYMPSGCSTRPAKHITTPRPRAAGLAATARASRTFAGPSASGASALRMAPVNTTGASPP